jgi:hypothetical protein
MDTPRVVELPRRLEPVTRDTFIASSAARAVAPPPVAPPQASTKGKP